MKYILLILLSFNVHSVDYHILPTPKFVMLDTIYYNGTIDKLKENSWAFESNTNDGCIPLGSTCRKIGMEYEIGGWLKDQYTKYVYYFTLVKYPMENSPEWLIIQQLWGDLYPDIDGGNHPITTLKVKNVAGQLYLQQYENSWQFDYTQFKGHSKDHEHVGESKKGEYPINLGQKYRIEIVIADGHLINYGHVKVTINEFTFADSVYRTKGIDGKHVSYFGQYVSRYYNESNDVNLQIITKIENLMVMSSNFIDH